MLQLYKIFVYIEILSLTLKKTYGNEHYCSPAYCNKSKEHVLCKFQSEGPARHCIHYERTINSARDKQLVLHKINSRRNKIAAGDLRSLSAAENMMALAWNEELAIFAQRWADQCVAHSVPDLSDTCRDLNYTSAGQSIATIYDDAPGLTPAVLVDLWYIELLSVNASVMNKYQRSSVTGSEHYDYFTQLIWAKSTEVGCGAVKFKEQMESTEGNKNRTVYRLVCNFAPAGNVIGKPVYSDGLPCSGCPYNTTCDSVYTALCGKYKNNMTSEYSEQNRSPTNQQFAMNSVSNVRSKYSTITDPHNATFNNDSTKITLPERNLDYDENISFDFFTDLFESATQYSTTIFENTTVCKEVLIVDELFNLLKRKLSNDQTLRELLLVTSKSSQTGNTEETFTDPSVAEILSHIYTTKESPTTTKTTNEYLNSTLLVDLVEAVIFRNNDKYSTTPVTNLQNQSASEVNPIKIRAELGETKSNSDFTGHYFFPEDNNDETNSDKQTDNYYDIIDSSTSDLPFDIEELRRNKGTKDFLEEILDSDFVTEAVSQIYINSNNPGDEGNKFRRDPATCNVKLVTNEIEQKARKIRNIEGSFVPNDTSINIIRKKRRLMNSFVNYHDLLRQLATDLKRLKLNNIFHCSQYNFVKKTSSISTLLQVIISLLLFKLNM